MNDTLVGKIAVGILVVVLGEVILAALFPRPVPVPQPPPAPLVVPVPVPSPPTPSPRPRPRPFREDAQL